MSNCCCGKYELSGGKGTMLVESLGNGLVKGHTVQCCREEDTRIDPEENFKQNLKTLYEHCKCGEHLLPNNCQKRIPLPGGGVHIHSVSGCTVLMPG